MTEKSLVDYKSTDWYESIVADCRAMVVEKSFNAKMEIIEGKWEIGKRILNDEHYKKFAHGSGEFILQLAQDIGISKSDLYDCLKICEMFNKLSDVLETFDKTVSWYKIRQKYLVNQNEKKGTQRVIYRLEEILDAFKGYIKNFVKEEEVEIEVEAFEKLLIKLRK